MKTRRSVVIIGGGCTGLGAAVRSYELGCRDFVLLEGGTEFGGLSRSFIDSEGFTWDIGGHVQFSHYDYFDNLMDRALGAEWMSHIRQSYIYRHNTFIPYPFQNNIHHLTSDEIAQCVKGAVECIATNGKRRQERNFKEWILDSFGSGIAELFMFPYNKKVWAHPLEMMSASWVGERVARIDLSRMVENVIEQRDDPGWGPNHTFKFPARGGTGAIWRGVASLVPSCHLRLNSRVVSIRTDRREVVTSGEEVIPYDYLISTMPLDVLTHLIGDADSQKHTNRLVYSSTHVVGLGFQGSTPDKLADKNWMYFPDEEYPFYRLTAFSNYSSNNVAIPGKQWSVMAEISESRSRPVREETLVDEVLASLQSSGLLAKPDLPVSRFHHREERGYPVPTLDRDEHVDVVLRNLESEGIFSRGRFGAWKYEVANQDHTCMQGVEAVNRIILGVPEVTWRYPDLVNGGAGRV